MSCIVAAARELSSGGFIDAFNTPQPHKGEHERPHVGDDAEPVACGPDHALKAGAREKNPVVAPVARNVVVMSVIEAASTASVIYFTERVRKRNRTAAVVLMAALNGTVAAVAVQRPYRAAPVMPMAAAPNVDVAVEAVSLDRYIRYEVGTEV